MAYTEIFYVSSSDNRVRKTTEPSMQYFIPDGKKEGKAKYIIEVFGYNHKEVANKVRDMIDAADMSNDIFEIRIETR